MNAALILILFAVIIGIALAIYAFYPDILSFLNSSSSSSQKPVVTRTSSSSQAPVVISSTSQAPVTSSTTSSTMGKDVVLTGKDNLQNTINDIITEGNQCDTDTFCQTSLGPAAKCSNWSSLSSTVKASLTKPGAVDVYGTYSTKDINFCYIDPTLATTVSTNKDYCITKYGSAVSDYMSPAVKPDKPGCSADPKCDVNELGGIGWVCAGSVADTLTADECTKNTDCSTRYTCDTYTNISAADRTANFLKSDPTLYGNFKMCYLKSGDNTTIVNALTDSCTTNFTTRMTDDPTADKKAMCEYKVGSAPTLCQYKDNKCILK